MSGLSVNFSCHTTEVGRADDMNVLNVQIVHISYGHSVAGATADHVKSVGIPENASFLLVSAGFAAIFLAMD
jgi:hypothetical protein